MKLIDKAAVVAEIETRYNECLKRAKIIDAEYWNGKADAYRDMLVILDTLEVKEVDLEKEMNEALTHLTDKDMRGWFRYFFELGLKARTDKELVEEVYSHLDSIKDTADRMTSGNFMHNRAAIKFSANTIAKVLELIGLKAHKGK